MTAKPKIYKPAANREEWLTRAAIELRAWLNDADIPLSRKDDDGGTLRLADDREIKVSVGWPGGKSVNKVIGQCWPTVSGDGASHLFVSPKLYAPIDVLAVLLHELIHAADDCVHAHRGVFVRACKALGLEGKPTATVAGDECRAKLAELAERLGEYPHKKITPGQKIKTQTTRMRKAECTACGYLVRTTQKWLDVAIPTCPNPDCEDVGLTMEAEDAA
jgi:hypothetical protein